VGIPVRETALQRAQEEKKARKRGEGKLTRRSGKTTDSRIYADGELLERGKGGRLLN